MSESPAETPERFEVRYADGTVEVAESMWAAHHLISRRTAFAADPLSPTAVLPAEVWKTGGAAFGRGVFVELIETV